MTTEIAPVEGKQEDIPAGVVNSSQENYQKDIIEILIRELRPDFLCTAKIEKNLSPEDIAEIIIDPNSYLDPSYVKSIKTKLGNNNVEKIKKTLQQK